MYNFTAGSIDGVDVFNGFIQKLDADGNFLWAKQIGLNNHVTNGSISVDASMEVYVAGQFLGTIDFDPGDGVFNLSSVGSDDIYVLKLNNNGDFQWVNQIGGTSSDTFPTITSDLIGNVYTTGSFRETVDFNPEEATINISSNGGRDIFVQKLSPCPTFKETVSATICNGDSYTFGSQILTTEGEYTELFQSAYECDSTVILILSMECVLGIDKKTKTSSVSIFPNPTSDVVNISFTERFTGIIELVDLTGGIISSQSISNRDNVNLELDVIMGTYVLYIQDGKGNIEFYRILKE